MPTTPPTWSPSTIVTSSDLQLLSDGITELQLAVSALDASAVKLNRVSNQSIPDSTWTPVIWNNQLGDLGGWWSSGTDIVMPSDFPAGVTAYFVDIPLAAVFDTHASGRRGVRTLLNGTVVEQYAAFDASTDGSTECNVATSMFEVAEADVITMEVFQDSGGSLDLLGVVITCKRLFPSA